MSTRSRIVAAAVVVLATVGSANTSPGAMQLHRTRAPAPLHGAPLRGETGLRLLVADNPPFVLDVDTGSVTTVRDVPAMKRGVLWVVGVGPRAAAVVAQSSADASIYAVRDPKARVTSLGTGRSVAPAVDGRSVWIKSVVGPARCVLRHVSVDGRELRARRPIPCAWRIDQAPGGSLGLVVRRTLVIDPLTSRTVLRTRSGILGAAGESLVLAGPGTRFTLLDSATRTERRLPWPSILDGLDGPWVDPRGRFVALGFADPSWRGGGAQVLDVWLLDVETGKLTHVPGMPAFVSLKRTDMAWTHDGRLVLLAESGGKDIVAVWRPGERRLALKTVRLPERTSGSDSFAPLQ